MSLLVGITSITRVTTWFPAGARRRAICLCLSACLIAGLWTPAPARADGGTTTAEIFVNTVEAVPSCFKWAPKGVCFWLVCHLWYCTVQTTIRVQHYTPDVIVSTYHDATTHPWVDYGRPIAKALASPGASILGAFGANMPVSLLDSAGTTTKSQDGRYSRGYIFRGADAIGNPANIAQGALSGGFGSGSSPSNVAVPTPMELMNFFAAAPSQIAGQWSDLAGSLTQSQVSYITSQTGAYGAALGYVAGAFPIANQVMGYYNTAMSAVGMANGIAKFANVAGSSVSLSDADKKMSGNIISGGNSSYICPPSIQPFALAYQSELDSPFWRGIIPIELVFPAPWVPGYREVGAGLIQTWGSVWPRSGAIYQSDPVKAAAVESQRVVDIISYGAQPHIYSPLALTPGGYRYFGYQGHKEHDSSHTLWQRLYPNAQHSCAVFGTDDSMSLQSYGSGNNLSERGTVFAAWRHQDCCSRPGNAVAFLGSVP